MLKFEEAERPSFVELAKLVLTETGDNSLDSPHNPTGNNNGPKDPLGKKVGGHKTVSKVFSQNNLNEGPNAPKAKSRD